MTLKDNHDQFGHDAFLTTEEVLSYLRVNVRTVYRLIKAGELPAVRIGRQWRFRRRDLDLWLDGRWPGLLESGSRDAVARAASAGGNGSAPSAEAEATTAKETRV